MKYFDSINGKELLEKYIKTPSINSYNSYSLKSFLKPIKLTKNLSLNFEKIETEYKNKEIIFKKKKKNIPNILIENNNNKVSFDFKIYPSVFSNLNFYELNPYTGKIKKIKEVEKHLKKIISSKEKEKKELSPTISEPTKNSISIIDR